MRPKYLKIAAVLIVAGGISACSVMSNEPAGPVEHFKKIIELDKSELARVQIKMGAGNLKIRGGSSNLMDADITYDVPGWKPEIRYDAANFRSQINIEQPAGSSSGGNHKYEWDLQLNDSKPLSLSIEFGAGQAELKLGSLSLNSVDVKIGVGQLKVDLRGEPKKDYAVTVNGGVGQAEIYLPKNAGVAVEASGGLGSVSAKGLQKRGDRYFNAAYDGHPKAVVRITVHGGIGQIVLNGE